MQLNGRDHRIILGLGTDRGIGDEGKEREGDIDEISQHYNYD
jgi:hypothetical protein